MSWSERKWWYQMLKVKFCYSVKVEKAVEVLQQNESNHRKGQKTSTKKVFETKESKNYLWLLQMNLKISSLCFFVSKNYCYLKGFLNSKFVFFSLWCKNVRIRSMDKRSWDKCDKIKYFRGNLYDSNILLLQHSLQAKMCFNYTELTVWWTLPDIWKKKLKCKLVKDNKRITKKYRSTSRVRKAVKAVTTKALIKNIITIKSTNPFILRPASESYCFRGHA